MNPRSPSLLYRLFISLLLCWAVHGTAFSQQAGAELAPSPLMKHETRWLVGALEQAHFSKVSVDKLKPEEFLASFLKKLDKQKLYFTQNEVSGFVESYSPTLITFFKQGNLFHGMP